METKDPEAPRPEQVRRRRFLKFSVVLGGSTLAYQKPAMAQVAGCPGLSPCPLSLTIPKGTVGTIGCILGSVFSYSGVIDYVLSPGVIQITNFQANGTLQAGPGPNTNPQFQSDVSPLTGPVTGGTFSAAGTLIYTDLNNPTGQAINVTFAGPIVTSGIGDALLNGSGNIVCPGGGGAQFVSMDMLCW